MPAPSIQTAIPKRRYKLGEYSAVLLGEVESPDPRPYHYIFAMVRDGEEQPHLYITLTRSRRQPGQFTAQLYYQSETRELGQAAHWRDADEFCEFALQNASQALNLKDEQPIRLL